LLVEENYSKKQGRRQRLSFIAAVTLALPYAASAQFADNVIEQNRAQERERMLRQQQEKTRDELRPPAPPVKAAKLASEERCVVIHQVGLKVIPGDPSPASNWEWALKALDGPDHDDSPLRRCIGPTGIDLLTQRMQDALVARGHPA
jgi:hemolysin activation/secretion protein